MIRLSCYLVQKLVMKTSLNAKPKRALMLINVVLIMSSGCVSPTQQPTHSSVPTIAEINTPTEAPSPAPTAAPTKTLSPLPSRTPTQTSSIEATPTMTSTPARITVDNATGLEVLAEWSVWDVDDIAWSPDSAKFAISFRSYEEENYLAGVKVYNAIRLQESQLSEDNFEGITFSPDGQIIAVSHFHDNVNLLDAQTGRLVEKLSNIYYRCHPGSQRIAYSPDGKTIVTGYSPPVRGNTPKETWVYIWDIETSACLGEFEDLEGWLFSLEFSPDGQYLLTALGLIENGARQQTYLWNFNTGDRVCTWEGRRASFSPLGDVVAVFGSEVQPALWDVETCQKTLSFEEEVSAFSFAFSPDGVLLATGDYWIRIWDTQTGELIYKLEGLYNSVDHLAFSPDGRYLLSFNRRVSAKDQGKIKLWAVKP